MNLTLYNKRKPDLFLGNALIVGIFVIIEFFLLTLVAFEFYKVTFIIVVAVFGIFVLYVFFNKPFLLLPTFLLSILAGTIGSGTNSSPVSFTDILFPILIGLFIIKQLIESDESSENKFNPIKTLYGLFLIWSLFTVLIALNKSLALAYWRNYLAGFIVFLFALTYVRDANKIKSLLFVLVGWGLVLSFIEFYIVFSLGNLSSALMKLFITKNLLATSWGRSNYLAAFHVLIIPITFGLLLTLKSKPWKFVLAISLVLMFSGLILTLSRGGILSLVIALIIFISRVLKPKTFLPLLGIILLVVIILLLNPLTYALFDGLSKVESSFSTFTRLNFYKDVWKTFLENPITGIGLGNLGYYSLFKITTSAASAHNIILGALGETGLVGGIIFIWLLLYILLQSLKNFLKEKVERIKILHWAFFSAFIGVLTHSMMEPNFEGFQFAAIFWGSAATFFRLAELNDNDKLIFLNE